MTLSDTFYNDFIGYATAVLIALAIICIYEYLKLLKETSNGR